MNEYVKILGKTLSKSKLRTLLNKIKSNNHRIISPTGTSDMQLTSISSRRKRQKLKSHDYR